MPGGLPRGSLGMHCTSLWFDLTLLLLSDPMHGLTASPQWSLLWLFDVGGIWTLMSYQSADGGQPFTSWGSLRMVLVPCRAHELGVVGSCRAASSAGGHDAFSCAGFCWHPCLRWEAGMRVCSAPGLQPVRVCSTTSTLWSHLWDATLASSSWKSLIN